MAAGAGAQPERQPARDGPVVRPAERIAGPSALRPLDAAGPAHGEPRCTTGQDLAPG
jgi:hypothetical protein